MLLPDGATKIFLETNSICMDFIRPQWLAAGILPGRNNGGFRCYVEFCIRAKTEFSYAFSPRIRKIIFIFVQQYAHLRKQMLDPDGMPLSATCIEKEGSYLNVQLKYPPIICESRP